MLLNRLDSLPLVFKVDVMRHFLFPAERKQSLGYDWHPECLRCEECGKRLNPGQHAEVRISTLHLFENVLAKECYTKIFCLL